MDSQFLSFIFLVNELFYIAPEKYTEVNTINTKPGNTLYMVIGEQGNYKKLLMLYSSYNYYNWSAQYFSPVIFKEQKKLSILSTMRC